MALLVNTSDISLRPFDALYLNNLLCTWLITAPQQQIIKFWFTKFDLVQPGDYLEIRDGINSSATLISNHTTQPDLKERWSSSDSYLWIRFISDGDNVASGFNLTWKFVDKQQGMRQIFTQNTNKI